MSFIYSYPLNVVRHLFEDKSIEDMTEMLTNTTTSVAVGITPSWRIIVDTDPQHVQSNFCETSIAEDVEGELETVYIPELVEKSLSRYHQTPQEFEEWWNRACTYLVAHPPSDE